jgi:uncharacterized membrane protein YfcA
VDFSTQIFLIVLGLIAGFIDSIAGGGGLITVPMFSILLEPGALAIGTNKIVGMVSTGVALYVYRRSGHVKLSGNWGFALVVGFGALVGAWCSRYVPAEAYKWLIAAMAPIVLWIVFHKDIWIKQSLRKHDHSHPNRCILLLAALFCGFYDGIAGPGGGTLMFLSLFVLAKMPLLTSMATAKIANFTSASVALATFAATGNVAWSAGLIMAAGVSVGAAVGAGYAIRNATVFARFSLLAVSSLLIIRLLMS